MSFQIFLGSVFCCCVCVVQFHLKFTALYFIFFLHVTRGKCVVCPLTLFFSSFFLIGRDWITATTEISNCFNLTRPNVWIKCFIVRKKKFLLHSERKRFVYLFLLKRKQPEGITFLYLLSIGSLLFFLVPLETASVDSCLTRLTKVVVDVGRLRRTTLKRRGEKDGR